MEVSKRADERTTRNIITGMIVSDGFLKDVIAIYKPEFISVGFARTVAKWCISYYKRYEKAPGRDIESIFSTKRRNGLPEDQAEVIEEFLDGLSREYEHSDKFNVEYMLDQAEKLFRERALGFLTEDIEDAVSKGDVEEAERHVTEFRRVSRPKSKAIDALLNEEAIADALEEREGDKLFKMPGVLGEFLGWFERDTFVGLMGPSKRGKSWRLLDFAFRALRARCNVAFFQCGDMSRRQTMVRIHTYNTMASVKYGGLEILVPIVDCNFNQTNTCTADERECDVGVIAEGAQTTTLPSTLLKYAPARYKPCAYCFRKGSDEFSGAVWWRPEVVRPLTIAEAVSKGKDTVRRAGDKGFKLSVHTSGTLTIRDAEAELDLWEQEEGFVPDVILFDYMDIMKAENTKQDVRHQENEKWLGARALSQKRHCCVIAATQTDAAAYGQDSVKEKNYSEDKRKYDHVTMMITLNQKPDEKRMGLMRIGTMFVREDDFDVREHVTVLQSLPIGRPYLSSYKTERKKLG